MTVSILIGDVREKLRELPAAHFDCVVTSPPYWGLRDYGVPGQIGLEPTLGEHLAVLVEVFREVRRVLKPHGTLWLNLGDSYASGGRTSRDPDDKLGARGMAVRPRDGLKPKDLIGVPWRVAFALQEDGWYLRSDIIWHKPNPMPESITDRPTSAHEHIFLFAKSDRYYYDHEAVKEPVSVGSRTTGRVAGKGGKNAFRGQGHFRDGAGPANREGRDMRDVGNSDRRNLRNVWTVSTKPFSEAHFATFPPALAERCIKAGVPPTTCAACGAVGPCGGLCEVLGRVPGRVLDPFGGAGTVGLVAQQLGLDCTLIELNPEYAAIAERRIFGSAPVLEAAE